MNTKSLWQDQFSILCYKLQKNEDKFYKKICCVHLNQSNLFVCLLYLRFVSVLYYCLVMKILLKKESFYVFINDWQEYFFCILNIVPIVH